MRPASFWGGALPWLALCLGCASAPFDGTTYRGEGFAFRVPKAPPSWELLDVSHASVAYQDRKSGGTIAINGRCGVDGEDVPLRSLTMHLFLQFTARETVLEETVPLDSREAMHSVVLAKLDGVAKKFDVWVMKKDGCVYDFVYITSPEGYASGVGEFNQFVRGFATVSADG
jgi:hypothetical protein